MSNESLYTVCTDNTEPRFFSMIPHMIDDSDLSPHAVRLYLHIKRVAGEDNGACWQTVDTMAQHCNMGHSSVSKAKAALVDAGLILIAEDQRGGRTYHTITPVNVWAANNAHMAKKNAHPPGVRENESPSPQGTGPSPRGTGQSPRQPQRITHEETPIEEKPKNMPATQVPASVPPPADPEPEKPEPRPDQKFFGALCAICEWDLTTIDADQRGQVNQASGILRLKAKAQLADLEDFRAWWDKHDWRGKRGDVPRPDLILSLIHI